MHKSYLLIILLIIFFLPGCKDEKVDPHDKFQIGVLLPLTGGGSSPGESASAAIELALDDVRDYLQSLGNDITLELIIKNTGTNSDTALQKLKELDAAGIRHVIGPFTSTNTAAVLPYANENDILLLSPASVATSLAISGDNLYRLVPSDKAQAEAIAELMKYDSIITVIPVVRNDVFGTGLLSDAGNIFSDQGINMEEAILYNPVNFISTDIANTISTSISQLQNEIPPSRIAVYLLSYAEGTEILSASAQVSENSLVRWYGSSAYANNGSLLLDNIAVEFAEGLGFVAPSFAPDPSVIDLWGPVNDELTTLLGRAPEVFALTTYDAVWIMVLSCLLADNPQDLGQFKSSLEQFTQYYHGITGRTTLDMNGDRKYASFNFWGIDEEGGQYTWNSFGYYINEDGRLVIY